ncbi:MAG: glycosyltransferase 87 family protein [Candidatus Eisenbacteria bacterium]
MNDGAMKARGAGRTGVRGFPVDAVLLFLLLMLNLPSEGQLEFGRDSADLGATGSGWARFFDTSLVRNPIGALRVAVGLGLLLLYSLTALGVLFRKTRTGVRAVLLGLLVAWIVVLPAIAEIGLRFAVGPRGHAHDGGVIQTEEAVRFLFRGTNPYAADYRSTPMAELDWGPGNPAIIHHPYFPFSFLVQAPFLAAGEAAFGGYDGRVLYLLLFLAPFFFVTRWSADPDRQLALAALWGLNPFLVPHIVEGRNDVVVAVLLVAAVHAMITGRWRGAALLLGLACATKQFAFLFVPFFVVLAGRGSGGWGAVLRRGGKKALPGLAPLVILALPFFLWDPGAFFDDTYAFNVGLSEVSYPLGGTPGYGIASLVNVFHLVPSRYHYFPFWIFHLTVVLPLGWLLLRRHFEKRTASSAVVSFALFLFLFLFFSRIFHHNYLGLIFFFLAAPAFGERLEEGDEPDGER